MRISSPFVLESKTKRAGAGTTSSLGKVAKKKTTVHNSVYNPLLGGGFSKGSTLGYLVVPR
jgi:hypothetical protein